MRGKILVIRGGAIGDFILTLPVFAALREHFPAAHLEVLGYSRIAQLAAAGGLVTRVQPIDARSLASFFARDGELPDDLRDYFSEFDIIISYLYDPDGIFAENVRQCTPGQFIGGPHRPNEQQRAHATEVFLKPLERLAIFAPDPTPRLNLPLLSATKMDSVRLALHPCNGSERKNWPEHKWSALIEQVLSQTDAHLLLIGGEAESDWLQKLSAALPPDRCAVACNLPLAELARRLQQCRGFIGHDSGITHLAAAVGLPCVVLWGEANDAVWRPRGASIELLRSSTGLESLAVTQVLIAAHALLAR